MRDRLHTEINWHGMARTVARKTGITDEQLKNYLIDVKGYSEEDLSEADLEDLMEDEDWMECEEFIK